MPINFPVYRPSEPWNFQGIRPTTSDWGPKDVSKQLQEGIGGLYASYRNAYGERQSSDARERLAEAQRLGLGGQATGLAAPGGPYAPPGLPTMAQGGVGPDVPPKPGYNETGKLPTFAQGVGGGEIETYIRTAAVRAGIDPDIAVAVAKSEGGLTNPVRQSDFRKNGVREPSYGPFQLYMGGGLGNRALEAGIDPRNPAQWREAIDFALEEAAKKGWGQWYGAKRVGIGEYEGIGRPPVTAAAPGPGGIQPQVGALSPAEQAAIQKGGHRVMPVEGISIATPAAAAAPAMTPAQAAPVQSVPANIPPNAQWGGTPLPQPPPLQTQAAGVQGGATPSAGVPASQQQVQSATPITQATEPLFAPRPPSMVGPGQAGTSPVMQMPPEAQGPAPPPAAAPPPAPVQVAGPGVPSGNPAPGPGIGFDDQGNRILVGPNGENLGPAPPPPQQQPPVPPVQQPPQPPPGRSPPPPPGPQPAQVAGGGAPTGGPQAYPTGTPMTARHRNMMADAILSRDPHLIKLTQDQIEQETGRGTAKDWSVVSLGDGRVLRINQVTGQREIIDAGGNQYDYKPAEGGRLWQIDKTGREPPKLIDSGNANIEYKTGKDGTLWRIDKTGKNPPELIDPNARPGEEPPPFSGTSVEAQALNGLVKSGRITKEQAYQLGTGKSIQTSEGTYFLRGSELVGIGIDGQPIDPSKAQPGVQIGAPKVKDLDPAVAQRIGMGNRFIVENLPKVREWLDNGGLTLQTRAGIATGRGEGGDMARMVESGREALLRGLTGAGMGEQEAKEYAQRYALGATDSEADIRRKLSNLEGDLVATRDAALAGRNIKSEELTGKRDASKIPTIKTDDEYDKLKSGSYFKDPDGNVRRKP